MPNDALLEAIRNRNFEEVKANIAFSNPKKDSQYIEAAVKNNDAQILRFLFTNGISTLDFKQKEFLQHNTRASVDVIRVLLTYFDVNINDTNLLQKFISANNIEKMRLAFEFKADPNQRFDNWYYPMEFAIDAHSREAVECLLENGAKIGEAYSGKSLIEHAQEHFPEVHKLLLEYKNTEISNVKNINDYEKRLTELEKEVKELKQELQKVQESKQEKSGQPQNSIRFNFSG